MTKRTCSVESCEARLFARGWCQKHYRRWQLYGDPLLFKRFTGSRDEVLDYYTATCGEQECHLWTGQLNPFGYGDLGRAHRPRLAHRAAWERIHGPIPDGLTIDHLCHTCEVGICPGGLDCLHRRCQNVRHMELVTLQENIRRGGLHSFAADNLTKTHCPQGHPYDESNTKWYQGRRYCRACRNAWNKKARFRAKDTSR